MFAIFETIYTIKVFRGFPAHLKNSCSFITDRIPILCLRNYSDTSKSDSKKAIVKVQGTETEQRLRVRLARPSDVPRVLKFVRDHVRVWPGPLTPNSLILNDYVARTLAQGHSMLAEQTPNATRSEILGLALAAAIRSWDADILERWANCIRCKRSKRLINFTAHCLRAPKLHENFEVDRILQVTLIVPPDKPKSAEIAQALAKNAIKRGKDSGFPLVRFDVSKDSEIVDVALKEDAQVCKENTNKDESKIVSSGNFVSVYTIKP
ncbi:uncharacterized protein LOC125228869 isoform X2 [Leguminivora glycinivorella]|uniref:uncharacterized protein LOC125228869 isoform X2 n=1 Tax=Leguminivora glycinivorella TaxID=1035111 RepID=UPI00200E1D05|nr:uncharacterized protein LOC125228869 isoform X2 [Leguminivora glycinivorella]